MWNFGAGLGAEVSLKDFRKDILLEVYNEAGQLALAYKVYRCWVSEYQVAARSRRQRQRRGDPAHQARERGHRARHRGSRAHRAELRRALMVAGHAHAHASARRARRANSLEREVELRVPTGADELYAARQRRPHPRRARHRAARAMRRAVAGAPAPAPGAVATLVTGDREALLLHLRAAAFGDRLDLHARLPRVRRADGPRALGRRTARRAVRRSHATTTKTAAGRWPRRCAFGFPTGGDHRGRRQLAGDEPGRAARCCSSAACRGARRPHRAPRSRPRPIDDARTARWRRSIPRPRSAQRSRARVRRADVTAVLDAAAPVLDELTRTRRRLYGEVHAMALHYHWSEARHPRARGAAAPAVPGAARRRAPARSALVVSGFLHGLVARGGGAARLRSRGAPRLRRLPRFPPGRPAPAPRRRRRAARPQPGAPPQPAALAPSARRSAVTQTRPTPPRHSGRLEPPRRRPCAPCAGVRPDEQAAPDRLARATRPPRTTATPAREPGPTAAIAPRRPRHPHRSQPQRRSNRERRAPPEPRRPAMPVGAATAGSRSTSAASRSAGRPRPQPRAAPTARPRPPRAARLRRPGRVAPLRRPAPALSSGEQLTSDRDRDGDAATPARSGRRRRMSSGAKATIVRPGQRRGRPARSRRQRLPLPGDAKRGVAQRGPADPRPPSGRLVQRSRAGSTCTTC